MPDTYTIQQAISCVRALVSEHASLFRSLPNKFRVTGRIDVGCREPGQDSLREIDFPYFDPIPGMLLIIQGRGDAIEVRRVGASTGIQQVWAKTIEDRDGKHIVLYSGASSYCIRRFSVIKELFHVLRRIFAQQTDVSHVERTIEDAIQSRRIDGKDCGLSGEAFCFVCAVELLIPYGDVRKRVLHMRHADKETNYVIAQALRLPLSVVDFFFESGYSRVSQELNDAL